MGDDAGAADAFQGWDDGTDGTDRHGDRAAGRGGGAAGRPVVYWESSRERKQTRALDIARADNVTEGLIAVLRSLVKIS